MTYKTVLFDMDGTLLDSLSDMHDAVNHILAENGWAARSREEIRAFVGRFWRITRTGIRRTTASKRSPIPASATFWRSWKRGA